MISLEACYARLARGQKVTADSKISRLCERCGTRPREPKERFCRECRKLVLKELQEKGFFRPVPRHRYPEGRSVDLHGNWDGSSDNMHRAYEDHDA